MRKYRYNYISADPGAGKTEWAIKKSQRFLMAQHNVMMVVPTIRLCDEIESRSQGQILAVHSKNGCENDGDTQSRIQEVMREAAKTHVPMAIVITDSSFMNMKYRLAAESWVVIKDEPKEPLVITELEVPDSVSFILDELVELRDLTESELLNTVGLQTKINWRFNNVDDAVFGKLAELKHYIENPAHFEVLFDTEAIDLGKIKYSVYQHPELFADFGEVYFMGANFEHSFCYHQWALSGVEWSNKTPSTLQKMPSNRLMIHYFSDKYSWSARARSSTNKNGDTKLDEYLTWVRSELGSRPFVYVANNNYTDEQLNLSGTRMPAECHGLNSYRDYTDAVLIGSYLSSRSDEPFYHRYGSSTTDVRGMRQTQYHVQQLTRTNIRVYSGTDVVHVYVPTLNEALSLMTYFTSATIIPPELDRIGRLKKDWMPNHTEPQQVPDQQLAIYGANVRQRVPDNIDLDTILGLPTKPKTPAERMALSRSRKKAKEMLRSSAENAGDNIYYTQQKEHSIVTSCAEILSRYDLNTGNKHLAFALLKGSAFSCPDIETKTKEEIKALKDEHLAWFTCGIFAPGAHLLKENCLGAKMIGFDLDGTSITDAQIAKIMQNSEYLQYTTVSNKPGTPHRRLRILVPYDRLVTVEQHDRIKEHFFKKFTETLPESELNLDRDKSKAWAKLFAPHAEAEVIWKKAKNNRKTKLLNVERILARQPKAPTVQQPTTDDIVWEYASQHQQQQAATAQDQARLQRIQDVINQMHPGNRSALAVRVGGMMRKLDISYHSTIFNQMSIKGVDKSALDQAKKYSKS